MDPDQRERHTSQRDGRWRAPTRTGTWFRLIRRSRRSATPHRLITRGSLVFERAVHAELLRALDVDVPRIRVRGELFARFGREPGTYYTMAGEVVVERTVYRRFGVRNGPILDPIQLGAITEDLFHAGEQLTAFCRRYIAPGRWVLRGALIG